MDGIGKAVRASHRDGEAMGYGSAFVGGRQQPRAKMHPLKQLSAFVPKSESHGAKIAKIAKIAN